MCANGPASRSGSGGVPGGRVDQGVLEVLPAQHRDQALAVLVAARLDEVVHYPGHLLALGGDRGVLPALAPGRLRVAEPLPGRVQQRQVGHRPGVGVRALQPRHLLGAQPGRALAQVGGDRPEVPDEIRGLDQRPRPADRVAQALVLPQRRAELVRRDVLVVILAGQDLEQLVPDRRAGLVVRRAGAGRVERLGPVVGAQEQVAPGGLDRHRRGGRVLVEPDGRLDRLHQVRGRLEPGHRQVGFCSRRGSLREEVPQGAGLHAVLAQAGQHVGDVGQVGLVRADEQHAAPAVAQPGL